MVNRFTSVKILTSSTVSMHCHQLLWQHEVGPAPEKYEVNDLTANE